MDEAFDTGTILRTHVMRPTWHFVARDDIRWLLDLSGPRVRQQLVGRLGRLGLDPKTLARSERIISTALEGRSLTRRQLGEHLAKRIDVEGQRLPHLLIHAELTGLICSGPRAGKQHTYALMDERVPATAPTDRDASVRELTLRYLRSHGPAAVEDIRWWSGLTGGDIKTALNDFGDEVSRKVVDEHELWSATSEGRRSPGAKGVHLLQTYDETIVGYTSTRYLGDPRADEARAAWGNADMPQSRVLVNGRVGGLWRRRSKGAKLTAEVFLFDASGPVESEIRKEIDRMARFLDREVDVELHAVPSVSLSSL